MKMNPSSRQCEIARAMTKSQATNEQITKELAGLTTTEWYEQCKILDDFLMESKVLLDMGWELLCTDFYNIAAANDVDEATLFVAYMEWCRSQRN